MLSQVRFPKPFEQLKDEVNFIHPTIVPQMFILLKVALE